ncbi:multiple epidermal growth factor-like domains protein 8 isoform X1 [Sycon ciliatum]|uniref:multiple epidermal growth factor-like domains protein 8 isoform X1 n=1 Tax=Sycon ciliatum TaxID=27933 RepID=UPI0031F5F501
MSSTQIGSCPGPATFNGSSWIQDSASCLSCQHRDTCDACLDSIACEWNMNGFCQLIAPGTIGSIVASSSTVRMKQECPLPCPQRSRCDECMLGGFARPCVWCVSTGKCHDQAKMPLVNAYGQCRLYFSNSPDMCRNCSARTVCSDCLATPSAQDRFCGWCMDVSDPQSGRCMPGSFDGPSANETCDISPMDTRRVPVYANHTWSFTRCPAVDWCMLKNTSCGSNASCHNDVDSGYCHCDVGFTGDGLRCEEWCPVSCGRHGHCSGSPLFQCVCDLGWTGEVCGEDCECNGWSTCASGRGLCDDCQNNTAGKSCELCKPLHFRNATSDTCRQCVCSDREDMSVGGCNTTSGACYCSLGYAGEQCEKCESGYRFYQGKSESLCLKQCATRLVTHSTGTLQYVSTVHINPLLYSGLTHCALVIIAADAAAATATAVTASTPDASLHLTQDNVSQVVAPGLAIELTIHWLSLPCNNESVLVYDDLHLDTSSLANYTLIGMVSGQNNHALPGAKFYSVSGIMTVFLPVFNDDGDGVVVTHRSIPCMDCPQPQRSCVAQSEDTLVCDGLHTVSICRDCKYRCVNNSGQCRCLNTSSTEEGCSNPRTSPTQPGWANLSSSWLVPQELDNIHECTVSNPCPMTSFPPRYEHTAVCIRSTLEDLLYVFGGIDSTGRMLSADVAVVSTSSYTWHVLKMKAGKSQRGDNVITPRYAHSTVLSLQEQKMYVFGGVLENNVTTSELWELSLGIKKSTWTSLQQGSASPLGRAFHSLTMTATNGSRELLLLGGYAAINSSMKTIISCRTVHVYRLSQGVWVERQTQGPAPSVYGHTASYVKGEDGDVDSVVVLGGSQYLAGHVADGRTLSYSDDLVLFRLRLRDWTWEYILPTQPVPTFLRPLAVPSDISGHQSVTLYSHLIVVIGGSTLKRSPACSQLTVLLYNTKCAAFAVLNFSQQTDDFSIPYLEYHTATPSSSGHTAYVLGGVKNGLVSGDMAMFTVPDQLDTWCSLAMDETSCGALDSSCLWCSPQGHGDPYCVSKFSNTSHCGTPDDYENAVCADNSKCDSFHSCLGCVGRTGCLYNADQASSQCQTEENTSMGKKSLLSRWQDCPVAGTKCYLQAQCDKCLKSRTNCSSAALMYTRSGVMYPAQMCTVAARNDSIVLPVNNCSLTCSVECPVDCSAHTTCSACVESISYSAPPLSHQLQQPRCLWSASQQACMSLDESNVLCPGMRCGSIASQESQCPVIHCGRFKNCHSCRQALGCGWCRQPTGNGTCLSGGPSMPDTCRMFNSMYSRFSDFYARFPPNLVSRVLLHISSNPWNYFTCPLVDECSTGTHNCPDTQICVDEDDGFGCACAPGFNNMNGQCVPVCPSDCGEYGQCVSPNVCKCDYHWTGSRCRTPCECNGHSDCQDATPAGVKTCLNCTNNTHGPQCNFCDAGYVDITLSNQPVTCVSCHKFCHWNSKTCNRLGNGTEPLRVDNTVCSDCSNNTHGDRCDKCDEGHFHSPSQPHYLMAGTYLCQRCRCNGHATGNCGKGGSECVCQNNTQSTECLDHASEMCYLYQCDRCRSAYIGTPVNGQQCYLLISSDDAFTEDIPYGGMRFFSIPPRYTNVDIRLTVVSHVGEVDVWLGTSDSDLSVESSQSVHYVFSKLLSANQGRATLCSRSWSASMNENTFNEPPTVVTVSEHGFRKCAFQGELVMRLPHSKHALHRQKFFLALRALSVHPNVSSRNRSTGVVPSHGTTVTVYYQQDLLQIDLIIFFSCFFSSFFLLLLVSMALWRFRAMYQAHVRRLQNVARREQNANRPFVQLKVLLPSEQAGNSGNVQVDGMQGGSALAARKHSIIAHQPIKDGKAWLSTSFIRLPSEDNGSHLALASAITLSPSDNSPLLAGLRRRAFNSYSAQLSRPWRQRQYQYDIAGDHGNGDPAL